MYTEFGGVCLHAQTLSALSKQGRKQLETEELPTLDLCYKTCGTVGAFGID